MRAHSLLGRLARASHCPVAPPRAWAPLTPPCAAPSARSYRPAWRQQSLLERVDTAPDGVLYALLAANVAVFGAWHTLSPRFMAKHFMFSDDSLRQGRVHTLLTSAFSQRDAWHLGSNAVSLYFFGREIGRLFGGVKLAALYAAGGVVASLSHVAWSRRKMPHQRRLGWPAPPAPPAMGASGAVNAIVLLDTLLFPWRTIYLNLILPVPALVLGGAVLLRDVYGSYGDGSSGVAHAGHVGGAAVGAAAWAWLRLRTRVY